jgi:N-acetylneuraminate lyase
MSAAFEGSIVSRLSRLHAALITPYDAEGEIAEPCLRNLVAHVKTQGIDGFYVGGSTGEALLQSTEERLRVLSVVAEAAEGSVLIGQVGAISTREAVRLARGCAERGYDAISAIPPIYFPHRKDAIIGYYSDILEASGGLPLIIYNIPAMSGVTFTLDDLQRLLNMPNVIGIKQTSVDMYQMEQLRRAFPQALLLNGYDEILLAGVVSGANGGVGSTYNVIGSNYVELLRRLERGDVTGAHAMQATSNALIDVLVEVGVFPGLKYILHRLGVIKTPVCRKPLETLSASTSERLNAAIESFAG